MAFWNTITETHTQSSQSGLAFTFEFKHIGNSKTKNKSQYKNIININYLLHSEATRDVKLVNFTQRVDLVSQVNKGDFTHGSVWRP